MVRSISKTKRIKRIIIVVDGNDGTGKTTLVEFLRKQGYRVKDRGIPSKMTDGRNVKFAKNEIYIILDAPVSVCRSRLKSAGKDLGEKYHTISDLKHYRKRFLEVSKTSPKSFIVDSRGNEQTVLNKALKIIKRVSDIDKI